MRDRSYGARRVHLRGGKHEILAARSVLCTVLHPVPYQLSASAVSDYRSLWFRAPVQLHGPVETLKEKGIIIEAVRAGRSLVQNFVVLSPYSRQRSMNTGACLPKHDDRSRIVDLTARAWLQLQLQWQKQKTHHLTVPYRTILSSPVAASHRRVAKKLQGRREGKTQSAGDDV